MRASDEFRTQTVELMCAAEVYQKQISWLWKDWLAKGKLHILAGQAGTGKTTLAISLAATISSGDRFADGSLCKKGSVLIWSGEDGIEDTLAPRLSAAGADLTKVHFIHGYFDYIEKRSFDPATDMVALMQQVETMYDLALLIIDPIVSAIKGDSNKNAEVRRDLQPLVDLANNVNCAVLGITHLSKGGQGKEPLERVTGSLAFGAVARIVMFAAKVKDGENTKRIICRVKSNIGQDDGGFEYSLEQKEVRADLFASYALWGYPLEGSAHSILTESAYGSHDEHAKSALDSAKDFLLDILANGELASMQIQEDAKNAGHSMATVRRAKSVLNIISSKSKLNNDWYWKLPSYLTTS